MSTRCDFAGGLRSTCSPNESAHTLDSVSLFMFCTAAEACEPTSRVSGLRCPRVVTADWLALRRVATCMTNQFENIARPPQVRHERYVYSPPPIRHSGFPHDHADGAAPPRVVRFRVCFFNLRLTIYTKPSDVLNLRTSDPVLNASTDLNTEKYGRFSQGCVSLLICLSLRERSVPGVCDTDRRGFIISTVDLMMATELKTLLGRAERRRSCTL